MSNKKGRQPTVDGTIAKIEKLEIQISNLETKLVEKRAAFEKQKTQLERFMTPENKPKLSAWVLDRRAGLDRVSSLLDDVADLDDPEFEESKQSESKPKKKHKNKVPARKVRSKYS